MKILFFESGTIWSRGLPDGLRDLGHQVRMSGPLSIKRISALLRSFCPDMCVTVGWGPDHSSQKQVWMRELTKKAGIPLVYWATEDPNFTKVYTLPLIKRMRPDFVFTISAKTANLYKKMGIPSAHMDFGFHPSIHGRIQSKCKYNVAVVANAYPHVLRRYPNHFRKKALDILIKPLLEQGIRIDFFGRDWEKMSPFLGRPIPREWIHGYLPYHLASKLYNSAKIILGLQNYEDMVTQRTYEILGSSGLLLTCNTPGIKNILKPGRDLVVSSTPSETVRLVYRLLRDSRRRERIGKNGRTAIAKHHYRNRARYMLKTLKVRGIL